MTKSSISTISKSKEIIKEQLNELQNSSKIVNIYTGAQLILWILVLIYLFINIISNFEHNSFMSLYFWLKIAQISQYFEVIFAFIGLTKTNKIASLLQVSGRILNLLWCYDINTPPYIVLITLFPWTFTEILRSLFYLNKDSIVLSVFRYNAFIALYPIGVTGEVLAYENFLNNNKQYYVHMRIVQVVFISAFLYLYIYMFKQRSKFYKKRKENNLEEKNKNKTE